MMKKSRESWIASSGFTLIEVLIAMALLSIVIASLYSTFFLSKRAVDAMEESLIRLQESRALLDTFKREIESALYSKDKTYTTFKLDDRDFYGKQASHVVFTSFSSSLPGLSRIEYLVEEKEGKLILRKKIASAYSLNAESKSVELMEDIDSFTVEAKHNEKWVKTWDGALAGSLPEEVRISVAVQTKENQDKGRSTPFSTSDIAKLRVEKRYDGI